MKNWSPHPSVVGLVSMCGNTPARQFMDSVRGPDRRCGRRNKRRNSLTIASREVGAGR